MDFWGAADKPTTAICIIITSLNMIIHAIWGGSPSSREGDGLV